MSVQTNSSQVELDHPLERQFTTKGRWIWLVSVLFALIPTALLSVFVLTEQAVWLSLPLVYFIFAPTLLDYAIGPNTANPPQWASASLGDEKFYDYIAYALIPFHFILFLACVAIVGLYQVPVWAVIILAIGAGSINGNLINVGHELGHRRDRRNQFMAKVALGVSGYGHFTIEHNRGHHTRVATPEDCASARFGETVYAFAARELPGAFMGGWRLEAERLKRKGLPVFHWRNDILQVYGLTLAVAAVLVMAFGWVVAPFIVIHHFFSWYGLTQVNYIEHYGLLRQKRENGKYEPCAPRHSWNANHALSNILSLNLQRHSDHHAYPQRPYQILRDYEGVPCLPMGYPGSITMSAFPWLWFKVMDPKVMEWAEGDLAKTNLCPRAAERYHKRYGADQPL